MRVLSPILNRMIYATLGRVGCFRSLAKPAVVTYHGVLPEGYRVSDPFLDDTLISRESFQAQLRFLKRHYNVIPPEGFLAWLRGADELPERSVLLTCDDGLLNNVTVMLPALRQEELKCLFFVTGISADSDPGMLWYIELYLALMNARAGCGSLDWREIHVPAIEGRVDKRRSCWLQLISTLSRFSADDRVDFLAQATRTWGLDREWQRRYIDDPVLRHRFQLLGPNQVRELSDAGMMIGAHTLSHPELSSQPCDLARSEISQCRGILESCTACPVPAFAYPFGNPSAVGAREVGLVEQAGYECAFTNVPGVLTGANRFGLPRVHVTAHMSLGIFEAHVSGFHERLQRRLRRRTETRTVV